MAAEEETRREERKGEEKRPRNTKSRRDSLRK